MDGPGAGAKGVGRGQWIARWVLVLAPLLLLGEAVFGPGVLVQLDGLVDFEPWKSAAGEGARSRNPLLLDQSLVVLPWLHFAGERLAAGELPLWNPNNLLGQPIHGALTGAFLWPLSWLYFLVGDWAVFAFVAWAKLALAGLGTFVLLGRLGARPAAALAGALGYQFSAFLVLWLGHPHTNVALLLPWVLVALEALICAPRGRGRRPVAALGALGGLALVAGHVPTALHVALFAGLWALWRVFGPAPGAGGEEHLRGRGLLGLAAAALLALALAAPQWLPFAEYTAASRGRELAPQVTAQVAEAMPPAAEMAPFLLLPHLHGDPLEGTYRGPSGPHLNFQEFAGGYVGSLLPLLAIAALVLRRREPGTWFLGGAALLAALMAWNLGPGGLLVEWVPGLSSTKPLRLLLVVAFALCVLGALGLEAVLARVRNARVRGALGALACVVVLAQLVPFGRGYNPVVPRAEILPATQSGAFLAAQGDLGRTLATSNTLLPPNSNLFLGVPLITGYDSIETVRVVELVALLTTDERAAWFTNEIRWFDRAVPLGGLLGVRWVISRDPLPAPLTPAHEGEFLTYENPFFRPFLRVARGVELLPDRDIRLARMGAESFDPDVIPVEHVPEGVEPYNDAPGMTPRGQVAWIERTPLTRTFRAQLDAPALVVLAHAWDPGWQAVVNGTPHPIERVAHALEGLWLPAGDHQVELRYRPRSFALGAALCALALPLLFFLALPRRPRPKKIAP
ncbi:MAG: YfhO family protein [Planctomycetaceae bacterium]|nr:YfhO family protein [Planctomycetaceae bacterium]